MKVTISSCLSYGRLAHQGRGLRRGENFWQQQIYLFILFIYFVEKYAKGRMATDMCTIQQCF